MRRKASPGHANAPAARRSGGAPKVGTSRSLWTCAASHPRRLPLRRRPKIYKQEARAGAPKTQTTVQETQAAVLGVPTLLLREQVAAIAAAPGYRSRGYAVLAVLARVLTGPSPLERVLAAGHLAGLWGAPHLWEPSIGRLRPLLFRGDGRRPP